MLGSLLRSSLNIGETLARFQAFGNIPVVIQRFIIKVKLLETMGDASFRRRAELLSRPLALLLGIFEMKLNTPWHDTSPNLKICFAGMI